MDPIELDDLGPAPDELFQIKGIRRMIHGFIRSWLKPRRSSLPHSRCQNHGMKTRMYSPASHSRGAHFVEQPLASRRGAFKYDFGARLIRDRLKRAGDVGLGIRPVGHLRAMEKLDGIASPYGSFASRGADLVATVKLIEEQFFRIGGGQWMAARLPGNARKTV